MSALLRKNIRRSPTAGFAAISGAAPQTINGNSLPVMNPDGSSGLAVAPGTLSARVVASLTTATLTVTGKWQVSENGSTWVDAANSNNAANVVIATGTGALVETTKAISAPEACYGHTYTRFVLISGVAAGGGAGVDEASIAYNFRVINAVL